MRAIYPMLTALWSLLAIATPLRAQLGWGADVAWQSRLAWRGLDRADDVALASAFVSWERPIWAVMAGAWTAFELKSPDARDATLVGAGERGLGELDAYAQADLHLTRAFNLSVGVIKYTFHGNANARGDDSSDDTIELYGRASLAKGLEHELVWWRDVSRVRGSFVEHTVRRRLLLFPKAIPPSVIASVTTGWSMGQHLARSREAHFNKGGFRYADIGLTFTPFQRLKDLKLTLDVAPHYVIGRHDAAVAGGDEPVRRGWWWELRLRAPAVSRHEAGQ